MQSSSNSSQDQSVDDCVVDSQVGLVEGNSDYPSSEDSATVCVPAAQPLSTEAGFDWMGGMETINFQNIGLLWNTMPVCHNFQGGFYGLQMLDMPQEFTHTVVDYIPPPLPSPSPSQSSSSSLSPPRAIEPSQKVTIRPEDQEPLQHYLSVMVQFAKIRSSETDHIYCYIFSNMALNYAPLYEALLAWSALHLAHVRSSSTADAEARYKRATDLLCDGMPAAVHLDVTLSTIWIMLQYELTAAETVHKFIRLLDYVADVVEGIFQRHGVNSVRQQLGPVGMRILMWLCAFEGRAVPFGSSCRLLRCLKLNPSIYDDTDGHGTTSDVDNRAVSSIEFGTAELKASLRLALRLHIFKGSCNLVGKKQRDTCSERHAAWTALRSSLLVLQREAENVTIPAARFALKVADGDMTAHIMINTMEYNWLQHLSLFYCDVIIYLQNCPRSSEYSLPSSWPNRQECAARIIRMSRHVALSRPNSPQAIWPEVLFRAGVETNDPIYQSWVVEAFIRAEAWGPNLRKTKLLFERIIECRRDISAQVDGISLMNDMGGPFVI